MFPLFSQYFSKAFSSGSFKLWIVLYRLKAGYLDFSHLTELKNIYITEIYMKKQYKSSRIKNDKITKKIFFGARNKKKV